MSRRLHPSHAFSYFTAAVALCAATAVGVVPELPAQSSVKAATRATTARSRSSASRNAKAPVRRVARRPVPALAATTPIGDSALASDLASMLTSRARQGSWGAIVTSITRGDTLFRYNADAPLMPASTLKLFTTALAFERLGTHYQFTTDVLRDGVIEPDGTLRGSLVLHGGGDPTLQARFLGGTPEAPMNALAELVANAGIRRVTGDVIGDATAFESQVIPDGWLSRYLYASYAARVSALSLNNNLLHVAINPTKGGSAASVTLRPALSGLRVVNQVKTSGSGRGGKIAVSRAPDGTVIARGWIGGRSRVRVYTVVVDDPALFTTRAFVKALENRGIAVAGDVRLANTPANAVQIGALSSPPVYQLATVMNGESDNHFAELLLRNASRGHSDSVRGSARLGNAQLRVLLAERAGVTPGSITIADGSGLSSLNRVTARALTQLLMYADRAPWAREFHLSLPVAGRSETLRHRMQSTLAQGNLHAKTGTTADVVALGGYVTSRSGELLAFSFLYNGKQLGAARETIDAMGATLAGFAR